MRNERVGDLVSSAQDPFAGHAGEVRTAEVVLHLEKRIPGEVIFVEHRRFPVLASGRRDRASMESEMTSSATPWDQLITAPQLGTPPVGQAANRANVPVDSDRS